MKAIVRASSSLFDSDIAIGNLKALIKATVNITEQDDTVWASNITEVIYPVLNISLKSPTIILKIDKSNIIVLKDTS
jgi:hypothetical protein